MRSGCALETPLPETPEVLVVAEVLDGLAAIEAVQHEPIGDITGDGTLVVFRHRYSKPGIFTPRSRAAFFASS